MIITTIGQAIAVQTILEETFDEKKFLHLSVSITNFQWDVAAKSARVVAHFGPQMTQSQASRYIALLSYLSPAMIEYSSSVLFTLMSQIQCEERASFYEKFTGALNSAVPLYLNPLHTYSSFELISYLKDKLSQALGASQEAAPNQNVPKIR